MTQITLPEWYQFDIEIKGTTPKQTLQRIVKVIEVIKSEKWFFLYENTTICVRLKSKKSKELEVAIKDLTAKQNLTISPGLPFQAYWEDEATFTNLQVLEVFANIMSEVTELTIGKLKGQTTYSNYTLVERLSHCIFNNIFGLPTEEYFLLKRLLERLRIGMGNLNDNPEQTVLDTNPKIGTVQGINVPTLTLNVPLK